MRAELRVAGTRDERIAAIARFQRGRVARRQLLAAGLSYEVIARAVRRGSLTALPGGVFAVGHAGPVELGTETAVLLALPDGAALSHQSAASIWEMRPTDAGRPIDAVVAHGAHRRLVGCTIHRARGLQPQDMRIRMGLPVTSPARTLLDVAQELTLRQLELAFDRGLVSRIVRADDVAELLGRTRGRAGAAMLAALLERRHGITLTRSQAEELFLEMVRAALLPAPEVNARVAGYEVDFVWPEQRLIVEIDGYRFHSTYRAFKHDHRKAAVLRAAGYTVLQVSFEQLERTPLAVIADVTRALVAPAALTLGPQETPAAQAPGADATPGVTIPATQVATISDPSSREMATSTE